MARDTRDFVLACSFCASCKTSNRPPAGLLQPLSVPSRPWSHISLDFVTALPPSHGNTVVLTVVDRFSKAAHFIPLPKLPSARETALLSLITSFAFMASRRTWSLTGGPNLCPNFGENFVNCSGRVLVFPLVFTLRATARRRGPIRIWNGCCDVWSLRIRPPGASNFHWWSTHTTRYQCHLRAYLHLSVV